MTVYDDIYFVAFDLMHPDDVTVKGGTRISVGLSVKKTRSSRSGSRNAYLDQLVIRYKESP